jgi:hypothetical protein
VAHVRYTVRSRHNQSHGAFSIITEDAREALQIAKDMVVRGVQEVEILDENGAAFDLAELQRLTNDETSARPL